MTLGHFSHERAFGYLGAPALAEACAQALNDDPEAAWLKHVATETRTSQIRTPVPSVSEYKVLVQFTADLSLATIREPLLRKAGFTVVSVLSREFRERVRPLDVDAALFCHTVKKVEALETLSLLHGTAAQAKTIRLSKYPGDDAGWYDCILEVPVFPACLVQEATRVWQLIHPRKRNYA